MVSSAPSRGRTCAIPVSAAAKNKAANRASVSWCLVASSDATTPSGRSAGSKPISKSSAAVWSSTSIRFSTRMAPTVPRRKGTSSPADTTSNRCADLLALLTARRAAGRLSSSTSASTGKLPAKVSASQSALSTTVGWCPCSNLQTRSRVAALPKGPERRGPRIAGDYRGPHEVTASRRRHAQGNVTWPRAQAAVGVAAAGVAAVAVASAPVELPKQKSRVTALSPPSAWLSSSSLPPTTPRGARADRSHGSSTCRGVYGEAQEFASSMYPDARSGDLCPMHAHM